MTIRKVHPRARLKSIRAAYETGYYETLRYVYYRSYSRPGTIIFRDRNTSHYEVAGVVEDDV